MKNDETVERPLYPTTVWSDVGKAGALGNQEQEAALRRILERYARPLKIHIKHRFRVDDDQAEDWFQEFVHRKILLGEIMSKASRQRGRFRTFLISTLDHFLISELRRRSAGRRTPSGGFVPFDELLMNGPEPASGNGQDPSTKEWARSVIAQTIQRMEEECAAREDHQRWKVFKVKLLDPILDGVEAPPDKVLAALLGLESEARVASLRTTALRHFQRVLWQVVGEYAGDKADVKAEIRELLRALQAG